jgi:hypothetical protein
MTMTRQHFNLLAKIVKSALVDGDEYEREYWAAHIADAIEDALENTNSKFDRKGFLEACKPNNKG